MSRPRAGRPGTAALALLLILVITAAWWALALWPAGAVAPEWLTRTRAACFGAMPGGLPDAGGWILLIGEPLGMLAVLVAVWGTGLREDFRRIRTSVAWCSLTLLIVMVILVGVVGTVRRVGDASGWGAPEGVAPLGVTTAVRVDLSRYLLVDQFGTRSAVGASTSRPALLTFAFGHCATICPTVVHAIRAARETAGRDDVPIVIITLDPWRDTPARLATIAAAWELGPGDRVLSGSVTEVEAVLNALGISRVRNSSTGDVVHVAAVLTRGGAGDVTQRLDGGWSGVSALLAALPPRDAP
jgi:protein SCO1